LKQRKRKNQEFYFINEVQALNLNFPFPNLHKAKRGASGCTNAKPKQEQQTRACLEST
jgi:hypothetical protein